MEVRKEGRKGRGGKGEAGLFFVLGLCIGAVLVRGSGAGRQVVEGGRCLVLVAVAAGRHPLVDAVQAPRLLEALDLVLRVEALNGCAVERKPQGGVSRVVSSGPERQIKDDTSDG